jgi:hypothetical protein
MFRSRDRSVSDLFAIIIISLVMKKKAPDTLDYSICWRRVQTLHAPFRIFQYPEAVEWSTLPGQTLRQAIDLC